MRGAGGVEGGRAKAFAAGLPGGDRQGAARSSSSSPQATAVFPQAPVAWRTESESLRSPKWVVAHLLRRFSHPIAGGLPTNRGVLVCREGCEDAGGMTRRVHLQWEMRRPPWSSAPLWATQVLAPRISEWVEAQLVSLRFHAEKA
jgi:hypothetical protein